MAQSLPDWDQILGRRSNTAGRRHADCHRSKRGQ